MNTDERKANSATALDHVMRSWYKRWQRVGTDFGLAALNGTVANPKTWEILIGVIDVTKEPALIRHIRWECVDTAQNPLYYDCRTAWDIEDRVLHYWNRLNAKTETDAANQYLHRPEDRVVVLRVREGR